jgi:chromosome segregation ATPase
MSNEIWIAMIGAVGIAFGAIMSSGMQWAKWRSGEKANTDGQTVESYARAANTAADTTTKLLQQIQQLRADLDAAMARIDRLETEREQWENQRDQLEKRVFRLESEKQELVKRVRHLENENERLRKQGRAQGLATND